MKIALIQTGKTTDKYVSEGIEIFSSRIKKYTAFEIVTIPELKNTKNMPVQEQKLKEGRRLTELLDSNDFVILLDERGKEFRTIEFATLLDKTIERSQKRIVFVIGGPWGFSDEVYNRSAMLLSLSKMTFPHQLVRLLFLEQLYRAFTILKGEPYHHE